MSVQNERVGDRRPTSDLLTTLMSGLDEQERRDTINTIRRCILEDREAAFRRAEEQVEAS